MNYLLTGAGGFIGSNFLRYVNSNFLLSDDDKLYILTTKDIDFSENIFPIKIDNYNVDPMFLQNEGISKIDVLILLGSYTPKSNSAQELERVFDSINNIKSIFDSLIQVPAKIIFTSTLDVYKNSEDIINEDSPISPLSFYGASKYFLESYVKSWSESNKVIYQILRLGHIYGPGEEAYKKLIPISIKKIINNETPTLYSDGSDLRSFLYVEDCCRLILKSISLEKSEGPINIVSSKSKSIKEIVSILCKFKSDNLQPEILNKPLPIRDLVFDNTKMTKLLGEEEISLEHGLKLEWDYFLKLESVKL